MTKQAATDTYSSAVEPRQEDPYELKHTGFEADIASPAWQDQEQWSWDCASGNVACAPYGMPPVYGEGVSAPVMPLGDFEDFYGVRTQDRDRSTEMELPPERTKTYASHPLDFGGQLMPHEIPHGAREASYEEFWGPTDWDAERNGRMPSYLFNRELELDGKEVNRPLDDFGFQVFDGDDQFADKGASDVDFASGQSSARSDNVRLMGRNLYNRFVTTRTPDRPMFLPPTLSKARAGSQPPNEADMSLGARLNRLFSAYIGTKGSKGTRRPPLNADVTLEQSKLLDYTPRLGNGKPRGGAGYGGLDVNRYQGQHYTSRETSYSWEDNTVGKSRMGKNAYLLLGQPMLEYRSRKDDDGRSEYQTPKGAAGGSVYAGEFSTGTMIPNVKIPFAVFDRMGNKGMGKGKGVSGGTGLITLRSNIVNGLKGGDYDDTPETQRELYNVRTPRAVAIIGGRNEESLNDLFDVQHS